MNRTRLHPTPTKRNRAAAAHTAVLVAALTLGVAACGTSSDNPAAASATAAPTTGTTPTVGHPGATSPTGLGLESGWAKAGTGMTGVFGTIRNATDQAVTFVGGSSPSASTVEVHTMAKQPDGSMRMLKKEGGLVVPAGGSAELAPGGDHIMLLGLRSPLGNGEDVAITMVTSDGTRVEWTVPVRSFAGAEESYAPEDPMPSQPTPSMTAGGH
jgi:copper(I)-binding protein